MYVHESCLEAGVVGAGGAGFPTHVKLNTTADIVLANGAECEPLLRVDQQVMLQHTQQVVEGMRLAMEAAGAKEGVICIKAKHKQVVKVMQEACKEGMRVFPLQDYYPAGDEQQMLYDATGRIVPLGGLPSDVNAVIQNVSTLRNIALAVQGVPVTHKHVTVTGEVDAPLTVEAPIGMAFSELIRLAGGPAEGSGYGLIIGGPMMGYVEQNWDAVVTKTTGGILVLPLDHPHYLRKAAPRAFNEKMARSVCCQCMLCTQMCPRYLLGLGVKPHMAMRATAYEKSYQADGVFGCCNCGVCSYFACPFGLSPSTVMNDLKSALTAKGQRAQLYRPAMAADGRAFSKVPVKRLIGRLGLRQYDRPAPLVQERPMPAFVRIPLRMHIGAPAIACVKQGELVRCGSLLARPAPGKLGVCIHASIDGKVTGVGEHIEITAAR